MSKSSKHTTPLPTGEGLGGEAFPTSSVEGLGGEALESVASSFSSPFHTSSPDIYPLLKANARKNRKKMTVAETMLWECLREDLAQYHFRRQHVIGDYIVDFVCLSRQLVIEVDGGYHLDEEQMALDGLRTESLNKNGFQVIRFTNQQVLDDMAGTLETIETWLE